MDARTAKKAAEAKGLELYYDTQWRSWGLIDPTCVCQEEGEWMSAGELKGLTRQQLDERIDLVCERRDRSKA